jgi:hypothetical protein
MPSTSVLETVQDYVDESRRLLQDEISPFRYPDDDLVYALNIGLAEARRVRPDLFLPSFAIPYFTTLTADGGKAVPIELPFRSAFVYYLVGRMQLRDDESTTDARAASLLTKFLGQLLTVQA